MKLSISLSVEDLAILDAYAREASLPSRSAAVQHAIRLLDDNALQAAYSEAWDEWDAGESQAWESTAADGLRRETR